MNKVLWILASAAVVGFAAAAPSTGCATTASDCAALGLPAGCAPDGVTVSAASSSSGTAGTGGTGGKATSSVSSGGVGGTGGSVAAASVCKAKRAGGTSDQLARGLATDATGHLLVGGDFTGTLAFGVNTLNVGSKSGFVALLDATTLKASWNVSLPATYLASAIDPSGDVIIAGSYTAAFDLGCGLLDTSKSFFIAKIDPTKTLPAGACVFSKSFAAPMARASLVVAAGGDIVLAGASQAPVNSLVDLGGGPLPAQGGQDVVIARYDSTGTERWSHSFGTSGDEAAVGVALDPTSDDVFITGDFDGKLDFATGGNVLDSGTGKRDIFYAAFDATGIPLWADHFAGPNDDHATGLVVVSDGVLIGGDYTGSIDLGTKHETSTMSSAFVVGKLKLDGTPLWATTLDGKGNGTFAALAATSTGGLALTGSVAVDAANSGLLVAALDKTGKPLYETTFPGAGLSRGYAIAAHAGVIDVAGGFDTTLDLGAAAGKLMSAGGQDVFVAHLCP